ncbi:MAG: SRPBCC domain-containing protein [Chitinophagaceae bacterium]|nr:SRPBCC domain-containing protein [Chitinophagaceae bacterium]
MTTTQKTQFTKDAVNNTVTVVRQFDGKVEQVWKYWTESSLLDTWWAPKPWRAETKKMDFREGGMWLYCMVGPEGERHWARFDYKTINAPTKYSGSDSFCDEDGTKTTEAPSMNWVNTFAASGNGTTVTVKITFANNEDMQKLFEMGFQEGFTAALGNLDELLEK